MVLRGLVTGLLPLLMLGSLMRVQQCIQKKCLTTVTVSINRGGNMIKKTIVILACGALIVPVAFAQTHERQATTTTEPITVTGAVMKMTIEEGSAANYQPVKTLVVLQDRSNTPGSYVLNGPGHVVNKNGEVIRTAIKPGARVRVYYANMGDLRMVDRVVVD
jgi:hypothetical protein